MTTAFRVVIPARFASTRLSAKPLRLIQQKPMIQWVYEAATESLADEVIVATDDKRIADAVLAFGGKVCLTSAKHNTGSDRLVEVAQKMGWSDESIIVNLQGDEPLMPAANINQVARNLVASNCNMATLHKIIDHTQATDPNQVKLVHDKHGQALYFSRSLLPFDRAANKLEYCGHIGLYAYHVGFLKTFTTLPECSLEQREKLEQLRSLWHGYRIHTELAGELPGPGVDTEADLQRVIEIIQSR